MTGQNQIYCNNCKNLADAIIVNKIFTSPEVLTIILNRGKGLEFKVAFSFQYFIDINNFIVDKSLCINPDYYENNKEDINRLLVSFINNYSGSLTIKNTKLINNQRRVW